MENNPHINQIHTVNLNAAKKQKSLKLLFKEIIQVKKYGKYDVIIDMQGLIKSALLLSLLAVEEKLDLIRTRLEKRLASFFYNQKVAIGYDQNTIERYVKLISEALRIKITKDDIINKELYLFSKSKFLIPQTPYIILVIGSTWQSRNYPKEKFLQVAQSIKKSCVVVWGSEQEKEKAEWMSSESDYIQLMPKLSLDELKCVISHASLLIGNDTGPSHMSWALNIPSIILFGPTPVERAFQTPINTVLSSSSKIDHNKLDKNDFRLKK